METSPQHALSLARRVRHFDGNVVDIERARLQRELRKLRATLGVGEWRCFLDQLLGVLADRLRFGREDVHAGDCDARACGDSEHNQGGL